MDFGIRGRVALVTAASRGLGKAVALELAKEGCKIVICSRTREALDGAADDIRRQTATQVLALAADVADDEQIRHLVDEAIAQFGGVDILFANAGGPPTGTFGQLGDEQWLSAVQLNLMSVVRLCRAVLPGMQQRQWGRILIDTSFTVKQPLENLMLSNAIRAGVVGFAKTLSNELAKEGITVNSICPGYIYTERVEHVIRDRAQRDNISREQSEKVTTSTIPMGRMGRLEEFAAAAAFLLSERASYITGAALPVDGGLVKATF